MLPKISIHYSSFPRKQKSFPGGGVVLRPWQEERTHPEVTSAQLQPSVVKQWELRDASIYIFFGCIGSSLLCAGFL